MKKVIMGLMLAGACQTSQQQVVVSATPGAVKSVPGQPGATDPALAVKGFMVAAKKTDLAGMAILWGDQAGLARDRLSEEELQKRELYIMRCLRHDKYDIISEAPALNGARAMVVQVSYGDLTRSGNVEVVRGPEERWYVRDVDTKALQDICMHRS